jgi:hypothetical protein
LPHIVCPGANRVCLRAKSSSIPHRGER